MVGSILVAAVLGLSQAGGQRYCYYDLFTVINYCDTLFEIGSADSKTFEIDPAQRTTRDKLISPSILSKYSTLDDVGRFSVRASRVFFGGRQVGETFDLRGSRYLATLLSDSSRSWLICERQHSQDVWFELAPPGGKPAYPDLLDSRVYRSLSAGDWRDLNECRPEDVAEIAELSSEMRGSAKPPAEMTAILYALAEKRFRTDVHPGFLLTLLEAWEVFPATFDYLTVLERFVSAQGEPNSKLVARDVDEMISHIEPIEGPSAVKSIDRLFVAGLESKSDQTRCLSLIELRLRHHDAGDDGAPSLGRDSLDCSFRPS